MLIMIELISTWLLASRVGHFLITFATIHHWRSLTFPGVVMNTRQREGLRGIFASWLKDLGLGNAEEEPLGSMGGHGEWLWLTMMVG